MPPARGSDAAAMRSHYAGLGLDESAAPADPLQLFDLWFGQARRASLPEPNAMVLATASAGAVPDARTVLLKGYDAHGLRFFTNRGSVKARELAEVPLAALVFPWHPMERQVRVSGTVEELPAAAVAAYFASRPRDSQLGAWASRQSSVVAARAELEQALAAVAARFPADAPVPVPPFWGGYRVVPLTWEFWAGRPGRMHDRLRYRRATSGAGQPGGTWVIERLAP